MANIVFNEFDGISIQRNSVHMLMTITKKFSVWDGFYLDRSLVASKDYVIGDLIFREKPFVEFSSTSQLLEKVNTMTDGEQETFHDFCHYLNPIQIRYSACRLMMDDLWQKADDALLEIGQSKVKSMVEVSAKEEIFKCLTIANLNAHLFNPSLELPNNAALFPVAAKINHSCRPNSIYSFTDTHIEYYAFEFIPKGSMITANYLHIARLCDNTDSRRAQLLKSKDFFCSCTRCSDFDYSYPMPCQACDKMNKFGIKYQTKHFFDSDFIWKCQICGDQNHPNLLIMRDIESDFIRIQEDSDDVHDYIGNLEIFTLLAEKELHRTHYLLSDIKMELCTVYLAMAHFYEDISEPEAVKKSLEYRLLSTKISLELIKVCECIEAKCSSVRYYTTCSEQHPPAPQCTPRVYRTCSSLIKCGAEIPPWTKNYLPQILALYGNIDAVCSKLDVMFD